MKQGKKVFSAFNGMGCAWLARERAGIAVEKRYSSEIDKHANKANDFNYPDTEQLGDIRNVEVSKLGHIDLFVGGSPCQSFSFAGKRKGMSTTDEIEILTLDHYLELKEQKFEFEGQSYLFWEFMRVLIELRKINPDVKFMLENVMMGEKWQTVLTRAIGINPIMINSALVSAQNRERLYWTNIGAAPQGLFGDLHCQIQQPKDRGLFLHHVLEPEVDKKYFLTDKALAYIDRSEMNKRYIQNVEPEVDKKANCVVANYHKGVPYNVIVGKFGCIRFGRNEEAKRIRREANKKGKDYSPFSEKAIVGINYEKTNTLTTGADDVLIIKSGTLRTHKDGEGFREIKSGKAGCVPARAREDGSGQNVVAINDTIRRLTPVEVCRLQTVPDDYFFDQEGNQIVSDTQIYKMCGNGWTIEVIAHILSHLK